MQPANLQRRPGGKGLVFTEMPTFAFFNIWWLGGGGVGVGGGAVSAPVCFISDCVSWVWIIFCVANLRARKSSGSKKSSHMTEYRKLKKKQAY